MNIVLYVSHNAQKTFNAIAKLYNHERDKVGFDAMAISDGEGNFALFFDLVGLTEGNITHELKHSTDQILAHVGHHNCKHCSMEPHAYLAGYLSKWIKRKLKKSGLRVQP